MKKVGVLLIVFLFLFSVALPAVASVQYQRNDVKARATNLSGSFAFVSEFTSGGTYDSYGWNAYGSPKPVITDKVNFYGEPSLEIFKNTYVTSFKNVSTGGNFISFQAAVYAMNGIATISIINQYGQKVAEVSVYGNKIFAGSMGTETYMGDAPSPTVYPDGWVFIMANIVNTSSNRAFSWTMTLFVDETDKIFANVSVPMAYQYAGIELGSRNGNSYFTDIIFTSYQIPIYYPGYNPMEGYGQGSGLVVSLLKPFTVIHANMILNSWNVPETGILSFQINVMNYYGTTRSTGVGFFQLGVDLDPGNHIAPWYVPGKNMIAHYFLNSSSPAIGSGFYSPNNTVLSLTIKYLVSKNEILFQIVDYSVSGNLMYWNATIPYNGTEFYGCYTQIEFQPSSIYPIQDYYFRGSLYNITVGDGINQVPLNNSYMLPFELNAPTTWSLTYYGSAPNGYNQIG
ncbi:MAG: hypothetical protein F9Y92_07435 [Thermoplasmatales archaeon]|nr:hypothetical protein [Thermoplasmatales archaeon]